MPLRRLLDPETSTRRTRRARERLAAHPMTTALLDAGVRLLLAELQPAAGTPGSARFFGCLSAARVCDAATRLGPLRTTPAHLRDRWPRHDDLVQDLLSAALWFEHHAARAIAQAEQLPALLPPGATVDDAAAVLARSDLHSWSDPVTTRAEVLSCALAASQPWLRAVQRRNYAVYDAAWGTALAGVLRGAGRGMSGGVPLADLARAVGGLGEGVALRLVAHGETREEQELADADFTRGCAALLRTWTVPVDALGGAGDGLDGVPTAPAPRTELADVLPRLCDPATGTRATPAARRRLANDGITQQLLEGGLAVLGEEFGTGLGAGGSAGVPGFFSSVSAARVVAEARAAGEPATEAQLRDRWARQEHYVDDLVSHALARAGLLLDTDGRPLDAPSPAGQRERDEQDVRDRLHRPDGSADFRLRLLLTTAATRASIVDDFVEQHALADATVLAYTDGVLADLGRRLADDVPRDAAARVLVAVTHGEVMRVLATGDDGPSGGEPALARATTAVLVALLA